MFLVSRHPDQIGTNGGRETPLTLAGLITEELKGKKVALGRYDSILWKIRSGYVVVLYGALGIASKDIPLASYRSLVLVGGFSLLGCILDQNFAVQKFRVVRAIDRLVDHAVKIANGEELSSADRANVRDLLHISGHSNQGVDRGAWIRDSVSVLLLYFATPLLVAVLRLVGH